MIIVADLTLLSLAIIATFIAAINDMKTREVPDWLSYGLVFAAVGVRTLYSLSSGAWSYLLYGLAGLLAMYLFGIIMFRTKQWGGGDAKLIMGLGVVFATRPFFLEASAIPFIIIILINILLVGAVYGLLWGVVLAWQHKKRFLKTAKEVTKDKHIIRARIIALIVALPLFILAFIPFILKDKMVRLSMMLVALLIVVYPYLWMFIKTIEKACLYKYLPPQKLTEGDWVEEDIIVNKKVLYKKKNIGIEKEDIQRLIKAKIKRVLVKEGIPFTPTFFLGIIVSLWYGNIIILF